MVRGGARFGVAEVPGVRAKLDQNESAVDLPAELKRELAAELAAAAWNRYPQPAEYRAAKAALAAAIGVAPEQVALTVGCDQVIQAAFLMAGGAGRRARWWEPTYPYLALAARATGTEADVRVLGAGGALGTVDGGPRADLAVLVAPNNPTGEMPGDAAVRAALADPLRLVLLDEAYADFAGETRIGEVAVHDNLLVGRSLSKSLLAGVRLGFAVGHPAAVTAIERLYTAPYHLNLWQLRVAARYGDVLPHVRTAAAAVRAERQRVHDALAALGLRPLPSRGNFIMFSVPGAAAGRATVLAARLAQSGVRVRDVSSLPGAGESLRVTVGTPAENALFLSTLAALLGTGTTIPTT